MRLFANDIITLCHRGQSSEASERLEELKKKRDMECCSSKCRHIYCTLLTCSEHLGMMVDSKINWRQHITSTTTKGNSTLGFVWRNVTTREVKSLVYKQLMRPALEYASAVWDSAVPTSTTDKVEALWIKVLQHQCLYSSGKTWLEEAARSAQRQEDSDLQRHAFAITRYLDRKTLSRSTRKQSADTAFWFRWSPEVLLREDC